MAHTCIRRLGVSQVDGATERKTRQGQVVPQPSGWLIVPPQAIRSVVWGHRREIKISGGGACAETTLPKELTVPAPLPHTPPAGDSLQTNSEGHLITETEASGKVQEHNLPVLPDGKLYTREAVALGNHRWVFRNGEVPPGSDHPKELVNIYYK